MNRKDILNLLLQTPLFSSFSLKELEEIFHNGNYNLQEFKKGSIVYLQNEKCQTLDIVLAGEIIIQKIDSEGNVLTVTAFTTGDSLGGNLLFSPQDTYPMTILCKNSCVIFKINKDLILDLCQRNKSFLLEFLKGISDKTLILTNKIKSITHKSIRESIIDFLIYEYHHQKTHKIQLVITKKDLAERFGIQRPSLSRELNKMKQDGLIEFDNRYIIIKDLSILNRDRD